MLAPEAERIVEGLRVWKVDEVARKGWMRYHQELEKLNMQAQISVTSQSDEFVVEALIDQEKIPVLIHDLLVTEVWKEKVLPLVQEELGSSHYVKLYLVVYHEAVVISLLEKAFYHAAAVSSGGDMLLELADYCYRRTVYLNTVDPETAPPRPSLPSPRPPGNPRTKPLPRARQPPPRAPHLCPAG